MNDASKVILIVDDEQAIRRFLNSSLRAYGYQVREAASGQEALDLIASAPPDLVVLDLGLPDQDGIGVTRHLREWTQLPIIILTVRDRENDKIAALDAGADDYLTKPFSTGELLARIRTSLRHATQGIPQAIFTSGGLTVDLAHHMVTVQDEEIRLTPTEYELLRNLVQNAGKVLTHGQLLRQVWGKAYENDTHLLRVNMSNLRRKLEKDPARPNHILTDSGVGYRLKVVEP